MTIAFIARLTVKEGREADFISHFSKLAEAVNENEPGALLYELRKLRGGERVYGVWEMYRDEAALEAHRASAHYKAMVPTFGDYLAGPTELEFFDPVT